MLIREFCHKILPHIEKPEVSLYDNKGNCYFINERKKFMLFWEREILDYKIYNGKNNHVVWVDITIHEDFNG